MFVNVPETTQLRLLRYLGGKWVVVGQTSARSALIGEHILYDGKIGRVHRRVFPDIVLSLSDQGLVIQNPKDGGVC